MHHHRSQRHHRAKLGPEGESQTHRRPQVKLGAHTQEGKKEPRVVAELVALAGPILHEAGVAVLGVVVCRCAAHVGWLQHTFGAHLDEVGPRFRVEADNEKTELAKAILEEYRLVNKR